MGPNGFKPVEIWYYLGSNPKRLEKEINFNSLYPNILFIGPFLDEYGRKFT